MAVCLGVAELLLQPFLLITSSERHARGEVARSQWLSASPQILRLPVAAAVMVADPANPLLAYALGHVAATAIALCAGWLVWLVGAELAFDDVTPLILLNGVVGAGGGVVGWLVVQRIRHQSTSLPAVAAGLVCGLVSVTAGAPLFTPVSAAVTGILAGSAACIFTLRRVGSSRRQQWFVVGSHLIAGAVGLGMLGLLATGMGYLFTGDTGATFTGRFSLLERQVLSTLLVAAYSTGVSFLLWSLLKRLPSWLRPARVGSAALLPRPLPAS